MLNALTGFALGLIIAWNRPADPIARFGAWFIMTAGIAFGLPQGWAVPWRQLPEPIQWFMWIPQLTRFVLDGIYLTFFLYFPRRIAVRRWVWFAVWLPVFATLPWRIIAFYEVIHPGRFNPVPSWILQAGYSRSIIYLILGIIILTFSYGRLLDVNEKRRVRVVMFGTILSVVAAIGITWIDAFSGRNLQSRARISDFVFVFVIAGVGPAFPICLTYAVLRHRVLDIHVIIRQGLQYALARGAVLATVPVLGAILVADLAMNSQEPLAAIMRSRGWIYAVLSGIALITYSQRKPWLQAIDRRFFREQYNAQRLLRDVVDEIREAKDFDRVLPLVVAQIETALHTQFVSVMVRQHDDGSYRAVTSVPAGSAPSPIGADSKIIALMRLLGKPLEIMTADSTWLQQRLPRYEIALLRKSRIELLVPIAINPGGTEALLALGVKRSEEPYTREDQELLETIASSLALLVDKPASASDVLLAAFEECSECGTCYDSRTGTCASDGVTLTPVRLPRTLAGRYQLQCRRGRGGMGTIYEAKDNALGRRVAVKVIRDDWVGNAEAAQRFRREARAAASFTHPNVVTVHDFGVEAGNRGFLVMEFLDGVTLREEIRERKQLSGTYVAEILERVCAAVDAAHRLQLIHRDLKPENIFLSRNGEEEVVKVLDFGIAKFLPDAAATVTMATHTGVLVGTPAYMSPEQLLGEAPDVRWDLWALAVVAYESLTGALPFAGVSHMEWRNGILSGNFTRLDNYLTDASADLQSFFAQCFDPNRNRRPRSATEFIRRFRAAGALHKK